MKISITKTSIKNQIFIKNFVFYLGCCFWLNMSGIPLAQAIPKFSMIMSRTAENHGHGYYRLEEEVTFQEKEETYLTREIWYVKDSQNMRLEVRGLKGLSGLLQLTYIYNGSKKFFIDSNGTFKVSQPGENWFEPYLHFRFQKNILPRMVRENIIPADLAVDDHSLITDNHKNHLNFKKNIRLSRIAGGIAYAIGTPTPEGQMSLLPGLWIEQDLFNVRKIRFPSQAVVLADEYSSFAQRFSFPTRQTINWQEKTVQIKVLNVKSLNSSADVTALLEPKKLDFGKHPHLSSKIPDVPLIKSFYQEFR